MQNKTELATFGAGCFWGVEETFGNLPGVLKTTIGYIGGHTENPTYEEVCTDKTGHVEALQLEYDPSIISYEKLLEVFWKNHDPTTENRQGPNVGSQYRSVIFYHTPEQKLIAEKSKEQLELGDIYGRKDIVTEILPATIFYPAEDYHQKYLAKHGLGTCKI